MPAAAPPMDADLDEFIRRHGEWSAMNIHLGNGQYTRPSAGIDNRLRRLVQLVSDLSIKPLDQLRVLDLACLEGHYAIEFALHGCQVVATEIRDENLAKARYAADRLGLTNIEFRKDDVRNLSPANYGMFDVVICSGIFYHLDAPAVFEFMQNVHNVCDHLAIIDTLIALREHVTTEWNGRRYAGLNYQEHSAGATDQLKKKDLWASIDNPKSFWLTQPSLYNLVHHVGFSSLLECRNPAMPHLAEDRVCLVAMKGKPAALLSSPKLDKMPVPDWPEQRLVSCHRVNSMSRTRKLAKRILPQPVKDLIKPPLRAFHILEPDPTPSFRK